jgi:GNAT superfamily N-acetyltransferase
MSSVLTPKLLIKGNRVFRLKQQRDSGVIITPGEPHAPIYEDIGTLEAVKIHFLERGAAEYALKPTPADISIIQMAFHEFPLTVFRDLYEAVSVAGGWWPLDDPQWEWEPFFAEQELYVLSASGRPLGLGSIDRHVGEAETAKINFVGLIPSAQGKGYGSFFFDTLCKRCYEGGARRVILDTVPYYDRMPGGPSAMEMYLRKGFVEYRDPETVSPTMVLASPDGILGLNQFNLPAYYKDNPLYEISYLEQKLLKGWEEHAATLRRFG